MMEMDGRPVTPGELAALGLCNYGHFTSMRIEGMRVRGLSLHLERLARDCRTLFGTGLDMDKVRGLIRRAADTAESPVIVRVTVFDPDLDLGHPGKDADPHVLVSTRPAAGGELPPLRLHSARYERILPEVKHVGLLGTLHHRRAAQLNGFDDVLFLDGDARISEGATWNIGFFDGDRVVWPQSDCLPGVTMRLVSDTLHENGVQPATAPLGISDVPKMRSAFVTNAAIGVRPVRMIDRIGLPDDPRIRELQESYAAIAGKAV